MTVGRKGRMGTTRISVCCGRKKLGFTADVVVVDFLLRCHCGMLEATLTETDVSSPQIIGYCCKAPIEWTFEMVPE